MAKKTEKPAADVAPKAKRSKLKLALLALVPLLAAGGGYAGWTMFVGEAEAVAGHEGEGGHDEAHAEKAHGDELPAEIRAETTFMHSYALSVLIAPDCGRYQPEALKKAAEAEAAADGTLAHLSWMAAARRAGELGKRSCGYLLAEIQGADARATQAAAPVKAPGGH